MVDFRGMSRQKYHRRVLLNDRPAAKQDFHLGAFGVDLDGAWRPRAFFLTTKIVQADRLNGHGAVVCKMSSRIVDGWVKAPGARRIGNCRIHNRAIQQVIKIDVTAQILQVSRQWFECVDMAAGLHSYARNQRVKTDMCADVIDDITGFEICSEKSLVFQLPVPQPESSCTGVGNPTFASSWTAHNSDYRACRN